MEWKEDDRATWPGKQEVVAFLHVTPKTVERWQKDPNLLRQEFRLLHGQKRIPIYNPVDVLKIKTERAEPVLSDSDTTPERQQKLQKKRAKRRDSDTKLVLRMSPHIKIYLNLEEAFAYSGLPKDLIKRKIAEKKILGVRMGAWRIRRESLERYDAVNDIVMSLSHVVVPQVTYDPPLLNGHTE